MKKQDNATVMLVIIVITMIGVIIVDIYSLKKQQEKMMTNEVVTSSGEYKIIKQKEPITIIAINSDKTIVFYGENNVELLKLYPDGRIDRLGKIIDNDKEVTDGLRQFLKLNNALTPAEEECEWCKLAGTRGGTECAYCGKKIKEGKEE